MKNEERQERDHTQLPLLNFTPFSLGGAIQRYHRYIARNLHSIVQSSEKPSILICHVEKKSKSMPCPLPTFYCLQTAPLSNTQLSTPTSANTGYSACPLRSSCWPVSPSPPSRTSFFTVGSAASCAFTSRSSSPSEPSYSPFSIRRRIHARKPSIVRTIPTHTSFSLMSRSSSSPDDGEATEALPPERAGSIIESETTWARGRGWGVARSSPLLVDLEDRLVSTTAMPSSSSVSISSPLRFFWSLVASFWGLGTRDNGRARRRLPPLMRW